MDSSRNSESSTGNITVDRGGTGVNAVGGTQGNRTGRSATTSVTTDYYPHGIRLTAFARQSNMQREEATPLMKEKIAAAIPQLLPL